MPTVDRCGAHLRIGRSAVRALPARLTCGGAAADISRRFPAPLDNFQFVTRIASGSNSSFSLVRDVEFDRRLAQVVSKLDDTQRTKLSQEPDRHGFELALDPFTWQRIRTHGFGRDAELVPHSSETLRFHLTSLSGPEHPPLASLGRDSLVH
ncbi:MAG: hypothetical protein HY303_02120 [Candidatus Wallbacteria bacterium]|nr:hypothetical protein [Candidatus Wallbacteria bacterium]